MSLLRIKMRLCGGNKNVDEFYLEPGRVRCND